MKKNQFLFFVFLFALVIYQSCTSKVLISDKKYEPTDPDKIELFNSKTPNREYEEIAFVNTNANFGGYKDLKKAAGKLGANAIIQIRIDSRAISGIAVRWK